jgi:putative hydrolase of the HAD superfamily
VPDDPLKAVLWDFGGVILSSPFEAFARYEVANGLPKDFIRTLNATNPDTNAWAQFERNEVAFDVFCDLFEAEAEAMGHRLSAREVMPLLAGQIRPEMVEALRRCGERMKTACLTNNVVGFSDFPAGGRPRTPRDEGGVPGVGGRNEVMGLFDAVIESSKVGCRKPDKRFYAIACDTLGIEPHEAVFLDDLGVNLKPARELGMTTIKVGDPGLAIAELEAVVGFPLR